jgi:hypothetical protein
LLTKKIRNQNEAFKMSWIGVQTRLNRFWIEFEFRLWASLYISPVYGASLPYCRKKNLLEGVAPQGKCCPFFCLACSFAFISLELGSGWIYLSLKWNLLIYRLSRMEILVHPPKKIKFP